jgi:hypothetical protein
VNQAWGDCPSHGRRYPTTTNSTSLNFTASCGDY